MPLVLAQGSQVPIRVVRESWGLLSSHCRANRPHRGLCPETTCSSPVATGISVLHSRFTWGVRPRLKWKQRTLLSSRVATDISWSPLSGLKGVKPPVEFGERTRDCSLGPAGKEGPYLVMMGESHGFSRAAAQVWVFSRVTMGNSGSLSCGAREVQCPFKLRGECGIALESRYGNQASRRIEEGISRSFSSFGRKLWVSSICDGEFRELVSVPIRSQGYCAVGRGLSRLHWVWCNGRGPLLQLRREPQGSSPFMTLITGSLQI